MPGPLAIIEPGLAPAEVAEGFLDDILGGLLVAEDDVGQPDQADRGLLVERAHGSGRVVAVDHGQHSPRRGERDRVG